MYHIFKYMHACVYEYTHIHIYKDIYLRAHMNTYMHTYILLFIYIQTHTEAQICTNLCVKYKYLYMDSFAFILQVVPVKKCGHAVAMTFSNFRSPLCSVSSEEAVYVRRSMCT